MSAVNGETVGVVVGYDIVFGAVHKGEIVITAVIRGVIGFNVFYAVAAYAPTVIEPPFGKVTVNVALFFGFTRAVLYQSGKSNAFVPAHGNLVVEIFFTAEFEISFFFNFAVYSVLRFGFTAGIGCAVIKRG